MTEEVFQGTKIRTSIDVVGRPGGPAPTDPKSKLNRHAQIKNKIIDEAREEFISAIFSLYEEDKTTKNSDGKQEITLTSKKTKVDTTPRTDDAVDTDVVREKEL